MPRARSRTIDEFQTSAAPQEQGSGCLSGFLIPPLAVILISLLLAIFAFRQPTPTAVMAAPAESAALKEEWLLSGKQKVEITYTLQPAEGGTWLKTTFRTSTNGLLSKLMAYAWVKPTVKRHLKQNAIRLQTYLITNKKTGFLHKIDIMSYFL